MRSALVLPVDLPGPLEQFRQLHVPDASLGLPAHVTLLYPFVPADELGGMHEARLRASASQLARFGYRLDSIERWPDNLFVAPRPVEPFAVLAAALAADWPEWPLYGGGVEFEPHVSLGQPADEADEQELRALAATSLPARRWATGVVLIAEAADGRWATRARFPFRG
jgi:hypothetical protein